MANAHRAAASSDRLTSNGFEGGAPPLFSYDFNATRRRIHFRYTGFWTAAFTQEVFGLFRAALQAAQGNGQPFTMLDDCRDWGPQSQEVAQLTMQFVPICRTFPIRRNAMIVPSALARQQVRRTLTDFDVCEIFGSFEEADRWLAEVEPKTA